VEFGSVAPPGDATVRARRRRRLRLLVVAVVAGSAAGWFALRGRGDSAPGQAAIAPADDARADRPARVVPDSLRITVEVVNATAVRGLGRQATAWLRDAGFDVVNTTTAPAKERRDSSLVLYGTGHPEWAALAARAIGGACVEARPDSLRFLDLTVLVGRSWRPPPQTLYP
jgi:hypothetical protein